MPSTLLAVDPGIRGCGAAMFTAGVLTRAAYVKSPVATGNTASAARAMGHAVAEWAKGPIDALALEWPRVYATRIREGKSDADPNDLLGLAAVDAAIAMVLAYTPVECFAPSDWKGQMKKGPCHARIRGRLSDGELVVMEGVSPPSLAHNVWDAVGIGLHRLGRFERVRVIAA